MKTNPKSEFRGGVRMKTNPNGWLGLPEAFPRPAGGRAWAWAGAWAWSGAWSRPAGGRARGVSPPASLKITP